MISEPRNNSSSNLSDPGLLDFWISYLYLVPSITFTCHHCLLCTCKCTWYNTCLLYTPPITRNQDQSPILGGRGTTRRHAISTQEISAQSARTDLSSQGSTTTTIIEDFYLLHQNDMHFFFWRAEVAFKSVVRTRITDSTAVSGDYPRGQRNSLCRYTEPDCLPDRASFASLHCGLLGSQGSKIAARPVCAACRRRQHN